MAPNLSLSLDGLGAEPPGSPCRHRAGMVASPHPHRLCHGSSVCPQCPREPHPTPHWGSQHSPAGPGSQRDHPAPLGPVGAGGQRPLPFGAALPWHCHCLSLLPSFAGKLHFFLQIHWLPLSLKMFLGALILPSLLGPFGAHGLGLGSIISPLNNTPQPSRSHE